MRRPEFITPTLEIVKDNLVDDSNYCKLKISPLERGYGMTIGNSLRRVMLSSLPGAAIFAIEMDGVHHEFCAVEGVREDVTEIILNLKNVIFTINAENNIKGDYGLPEDQYRLELDVELPSLEEQKKLNKDGNLVYEKVVTAGDINTASTEDIQVVNPEQPILTLAPGAKVRMSLFIRNGVGYVSAEENKRFCKEGNARVIDRLPIDSIFTQV